MSSNFRSDIHHFFPDSVHRSQSLGSVHTQGGWWWGAWGWISKDKIPGLGDPWRPSQKLLPVCPLASPNDSHSSHKKNTSAPLPRFLKASSHFASAQISEPPQIRPRDCRKLLGTNSLHTAPRIEFPRIYRPVKQKTSTVSGM